MLRSKMILSVLVIAASGMAANAADLPAPSPLGAIFAEPYEVHPYPRSYEVAAQIITYNALAKFSMLPGGYLYGGPNTYFYPGPYYGGPYYTDGVRLPYACSLYGYC
jgi:hypothetical protein